MSLPTELGSILRLNYKHIAPNGAKKAQPFRTEGC
jgi:hypothetical protein